MYQVLRSVLLSVLPAFKLTLLQTWEIICLLAAKTWWVYGYVWRVRYNALVMYTCQTGEKRVCIYRNGQRAMANLSQQKRERMLTFLNKVKEEHKDDDETLVALDEIENELNSKKYGLVWEKHEEQVDVMMQDNIPVFSEVHEREIKAKDENSYNFLLEGDNLHSLKLLEKTHAGKIDVIYIDPPYNTESKEFIYDDYRIGEDDAYRHSKWLSFMNERLRIAKRLLSDDGVIFISIDDNEIAQLKLLCDDSFDTKNFLGNITWIKKTKPINSGNTRLQLQSAVEYVLVYKNDSSVQNYSFKLRVKESRSYTYKTQYGNARLKDILDSDLGRKNRDTMKFPILGIFPPAGQRWKIGKQEAERLLLRHRIVVENKRIKVLVYPEDEDTNKYSPFWSHYSKDIGTAESAKAEMKNIIGSSKQQFETVKPEKLINDFLFHACGNNKNAIILDFFAGSGTTAHAVLELNKEDGGNRKFILCTNNENNICEDVTYERIKRVIHGYSYVKEKKNGNELVNVEGIPANLKYFKTDFISKDADDVSEELLSHIKEMVELENGITLDNKHYLIVLTDEQADELVKNWSRYEDVRAIYVSRDVLLTSEQQACFAGAEIHVIPDYYFEYELKEAGEAW